MAGTDWVILAGGGFLAGIINALAGGGSLLTVPLLILFGLPPIVANGTNRLGVLCANVTSAWEFQREGFAGFQVASRVVIPVLVGSLLGAVAISQVSDDAFRRVFAVIMLLLLIPMIRRPAFLAGHNASGFTWSPTTTFVVFLAIGFYGGAIQAGVGIFLIFALTYAGYDLVRANSIKVVIGTVLTAIALPVFIFQGQVDWEPGIALAVGFSCGGLVGARWAVVGGERLIRPVLVVAVIALAGRMLSLY